MRGPFDFEREGARPAPPVQKPVHDTHAAALAFETSTQA